MGKDASGTDGKRHDSLPTAALSRLAGIQRRLPKGDDDNWWSRGALWSGRSTFRMPMSRSEFEDALRWIAKGKDPDWRHSRAGRESAYFLLQFLNQLPERFRPSQEEVDLARATGVRQHLLETINLAIDDYRNAEKRLLQEGADHEIIEFWDEDTSRLVSHYRLDHSLNALITPYVLHVWDFIERANLPVKFKVKSESLAKVLARSKLRWLLAVKAELIAQ